MFGESNIDRIRNGISGWFWDLSPLNSKFKKGVCMINVYTLTTARIMIFDQNIPMITDGVDMLLQADPASDRLFGFIMRGRTKFEFRNFQYNYNRCRIEFCTVPASAVAPKNWQKLEGHIDFSGAQSLIAVP